MQPPPGDQVRELEPVLARFPEHEDSVRELARRNQQFMELCADYGECVAALRRFRNQGADAVERVEQYTEFRASLEQELLTDISAFLKPGRIPGSKRHQTPP